jgi:GntR family transcriptional regulator, rspAB operon transcriptional repressor
MSAMLSQSDLDRKRPLRDQVYSVLRERILTGHIPPGGTIDDKEIAAELGISRTPVREAIKKLSDEHLVDVIAQSGTRASRIDRHEVRQAYLIRRALEMESAGQAASLMSEAHLEALNAIYKTHERLLEQKRFVDAITTDDHFHRYIAGISNLGRLWTMVEISKAQLDRCRHIMVPRPGEPELTLKHHRDVIKGLQSSPEAAREAMAKHLDAAFGNTMKVLEAENVGSFAPFTRIGK